MVVCGGLQGGGGGLTLTLLQDNGGPRPRTRTAAPARVPPLGSNPKEFLPKALVTADGDCGRCVLSNSVKNKGSYDMGGGGEHLPHTCRTGAGRSLRGD